MIKTSTKKRLSTMSILALLGILIFGVSEGFAQNADSLKITLRGKSTAVSRVPQIKVNVPVYKSPYSITNFNSIINSPKTPSAKAEKNLTVTKIFPNPVTDQVNIIVRLEKESNLSIKIIDPLGNEVMTLVNERTNAGEQTRTFTFSKRLNTGFYFIRLIAGQESVSKRISVL